MTRTKYARWSTGATIYAKPRPLDDNLWGDDVIVAVENAALGEYAFASLSDVLEYEIYVQSGGAPANSDLPIGEFDIDPVGGPIEYGTLSAALALQLASLSNKATAISLSTDVSVVRGTTWRIPIADLPVGWEKVELTVRSSDNAIQSESLLHVILTNPADADDGLLIFNASTVVTQADAAIDTGVSPPVCTVNAATSTAAIRGEYCWDAKVWVSGEPDELAFGKLFVENDVTRTVA